MKVRKKQCNMNLSPTSWDCALNESKRMQKKKEHKSFSMS